MTRFSITLNRGGTRSELGLKIAFGPSKSYSNASMKLYEIVKVERCSPPSRKIYGLDKGESQC